VAGVAEVLEDEGPAQMSDEDNHHEDTMPHQ
jgi:hypothetical protein